MISCPECKNPKPRVHETRGVRRRYHCKCGFRFTTRELVVAAGGDLVESPPAKGWPSVAQQPKARPKPVSIPKTAEDLPPPSTARRDAAHLIEDRRYEKELEDYYG